MAHALKADGAIVPEPSGFDVWIACRGSLPADDHRRGPRGPRRPAPRHPDLGGAVNAIEKMRSCWRPCGGCARSGRCGRAIRTSRPADCVPTIIAGGEWLVSYPAGCRLDCHIEFLPDQADERGCGSAWRGSSPIGSRARRPPTRGWRRTRRRSIGWRAPCRRPRCRPTTRSCRRRSEPSPPSGGRARSAASTTGTTARRSWPRRASRRSVSGRVTSSWRTRPTSRVPIADLVACMQALAIAAMRFCGVAG